MVSGSVNPKYPVYIVSKGRWESRLTSKALEAINVPYLIVVEPQERELYESVIAKEKILTLPFGNLGQGSIPARNWIWEHSVRHGYGHHWILDDNIRGFLSFNHNQKTKVDNGEMFLSAEMFCERYCNVALAGFQYAMFIMRKKGLSNRKVMNGVTSFTGSHPAIITNTRIYSCILINNSIPFRWRGRYNEDTDLSLRVLKSGLCTVLFNAFLADKQATMKMRGGNTDELYRGDGRLKMATSLMEQHPDCVKITNRKYGRWQHQVDYRKFKGNKFVPKEEAHAEA